MCIIFHCKNVLTVICLSMTHNNPPWCRLENFPSLSATFPSYQSSLLSVCLLTDWTELSTQLDQLPSLPLLPSQNLTTVLSTTIFPNKSTPADLENFVLPALWSKLLNLLISHPSSDFCSGSRLTNALNMNSCHSSTKFL